MSDTAAVLNPRSCAAEHTAVWREAPLPPPPALQLPDQRQL